MDDNELWEKKQVDFLHSIWCTQNQNVRNMSMKDAFSNSKHISGAIINESIKDCLIFTFYDNVNYLVEKDTFVKITFEELLEFCEEVELFVMEEEKEN